MTQEPDFGASENLKKYPTNRGLGVTIDQFR